MVMARCAAATKKHQRCRILADPGSEFCHIHRPDGLWAKQHRKGAPATWNGKPSPANKGTSSTRTSPAPMVRVAGGRRVYTDGACSGNPGPGGWAWIVDGPDHWSASGGDPATTNQRMELRAALEAVLAIPGPLTVVSDSRYLVDCFADGWWVKWLRRDWMRTMTQPVKNRDLWEPLVGAYRERHGSASPVAFEWVRGHAGDVWNERADRLAAAAVPSVYPRRRRVADRWVFV